MRLELQCYVRTSTTLLRILIYHFACQMAVTRRTFFQVVDKCQELHAFNPSLFLVRPHFNREEGLFGPSFWTRSKRAISRPITIE